MNAGEVVSITRYCKIKDVLTDTRIGVVDVKDNTEFYINGQDLLDDLKSADAFSKTEKLTKTQMAEKLVSAKNDPFTVVFLKSDKTQRKLRGRLLSSEPLLGRSYVEDFDIAGENKTRLVDHRTIQSLIIGNIKYELSH